MTEHSAEEACNAPPAILTCVCEILPNLPENTTLPTQIMGENTNEKALL